jgi:1L-myo-inositol 1-phosphate cytidylyltransferase
MSSVRSARSTATPVRRAIILAAGRGSRLVTGETIPKPLKEVAGVPLLVRILRTLQSEGIREAVIVIGYCGDQIRTLLTADSSLKLRLVFVENEQWDRGANGISLLAAREHLDEDCILSMADHLYSPEIVRRLQEADLAGGCALAVDRDIEGCFDLPDATKVKLSGSQIVDIHKELADYDALDTGVFRVNRKLGDSLQAVYERSGDASLSDGVRALSATGAFRVIDTTRARWIDVDTPEAHAQAEKMIRLYGDTLSTTSVTAPGDALRV